jgi:tetratricopeptide (TPR) repeat protein
MSLEFPAPSSASRPAAAAAMLKTFSALGATYRNGILGSRLPLNWGVFVVRSFFSSFRKPSAWLVLLVVLLAAPAARAQGGANADICASTNDAAYAPERRIAACGALIDALKDQPKALATALVNRGAAYWTINKVQLSLGDFDRAIALDPENARAFRERSNACRSIGRLDQALADANQAVRLDPNDAKAFDNRGNVFNNNGQYDRAIDDYAEALRLAPGDAQTYMDRGVAYYFKKDYQSAINDYDQAIRIDPKKSRAYTNRGAAYKKLGRNDRAIADESEAIRLDPLVPEFYDNRGLSYAGNGDYDRAIADYNEAIRLSPQAKFLTNRGDSYNHKGDLDRAIADYDRAIALDPNFSLAYNNRGAAYRNKGDLDRAIADYEQAVRINPQFDLAAENLAAVRQARDRRGAVNSDKLLPSFDCRSAREAAEKAICSDPDLARLDREIAAAYKAALADPNNKAVAQLRREQRDFIAARNKSFGNPQYNLKHEMEARLAALRGTSAKASQ